MTTSLTRRILPYCGHVRRLRRLCQPADRATGRAGHRLKPKRAKPGPAARSVLFAALQKIHDADTPARHDTASTSMQKRRVAGKNKGFSLSAYRSIFWSRCSQVQHRLRWRRRWLTLWVCGCALPPSSRRWRSRRRRRHLFCIWRPGLSCNPAARSGLGPFPARDVSGPFVCRLLIQRPARARRSAELISESPV